MLEEKPFWKHVKKILERRLQVVEANLSNNSIMLHDQVEVANIDPN